MGLDPQQIKAVETATGHSVFGASSLPRIVECPASVMMELRAGLKRTSVYAERGTKLHSVTEAGLRSANPESYVYSLDLDIEDTSNVLDAIKYVYKVLENHSGEAVFMTLDKDGNYSASDAELITLSGKTAVMLEVSGSLSSYGIPESYGTSDVVIMSLGRVDVIDHKFGHGVAVYATGNYQLVGYLGMAVPFHDMQEEIEHRRMFVHINQPPLNIYDEWEVDRATLLQMLLGDVNDAIEKAKSDDPPFGPSAKACRFCGANRGCKARHNSLVGQAKLIQQMAKDPSMVSNEQWAVFLEAADSLETAIKQVKDHAIEEIQRGNDFPGFKLVAGRSNRKFVDEDKAREFMVARLGKRAFKEPELITLAQAEKVDKSLKSDDEWKALVYTPPGAPKLVRVSDKGEALAYGVRGLMQELAQEERKNG